jgi:hypothetical protein
MNITEYILIFAFAIFSFFAFHFLLKTDAAYRKYQESIHPLFLMLILIIIFGYTIFQTHIGQKTDWVQLIAYLVLVGYFVFRTTRYIRHRNQKS